MFRVGSPLRERALQATGAAILSCALAASGAAAAQALNTADPNFHDAAGQSAYDGGAAPEISATRGIFLATVAKLIAQGVGAEIGGSLWKGAGGWITKWFGDKPASSTNTPVKQDASTVKTTRDTSVPPHAGIAYEVHLIGRDGAARPVDPARHVFHTNDEFLVYYRPALPGRVKVFNVGPRGDESRIDAVEVAAGQLATLGPYRFVEDKGRETLKLMLEPCNSPALTAVTRRIVNVSAGSTTKPALRLADCRDLTANAARAAARTIDRITVDGATTFALDPLSREEAKSGLLAAREVRIAFQHG